MSVIPSPSVAPSAARTSGRQAVVTLVVVLAMSLLVASPLANPAHAVTSAESTAEKDFHALVNIERAKHGLGALTVRHDIVEVARSHSARMAGEWRLFHNPDYGEQITGWRRLSENVGYGPSVGPIHDALMASDGHRRNILDDQVTEVGIGVTVKDGRVWVTQNFRRPSAEVTTSPPSTASYGDVASTSIHAFGITTVGSRGITDPCGSARFCPDSTVTRGQFATMLVRALGLEPQEPGTFSDVSGASAHDIEALVAAGLTTGCAPARFCPDQRLTREQLATFFAQALELDPQPSPFADMSPTHDGSVGALHAEGIVKGCTLSTFCPREDSTRAQTATMIAQHLS